MKDDRVRDIGLDHLANWLPFGKTVDVFHSASFSLALSLSHNKRLEIGDLENWSSPGSRIGKLKQGRSQKLRARRVCALALKTTQFLEKGSKRERERERETRSDTITRDLAA